AIPAAESTLVSHPCVALYSAQVLPEWTTSTSPCHDFSSNGDNPLNFVSHYKGSLHRLSLSPLLLHFLRSLPEEQIRRDRSSEDPDQRRPIATRPFNVGNKSRADHHSPIGFREKRGQDIGEEHERQPFADRS